MPIATPSTLLAGIPPGGSVPSLGWVLSVGITLGIIVVINFFWERKKGPPNP